MSLFMQLDVLSNLGYMIDYEAKDNRKRQKGLLVLQGQLPKFSYRVHVRFKGKLLLSEEYPTAYKALQTGVDFGLKHAADARPGGFSPSEIIPADLESLEYNPALWELGYPGFPKGSVVHGVKTPHGGTRTRIALLPIGTMFTVESGEWSGRLEKDENGELYIYTGAGSNRIYIDETYSADITIRSWGTLAESVH